MQNVLSTGKRAVSAAVVAATMLFSVGAGLLQPSVAGAASAGDLIKGTSLSTVYYYGYDGMRYTFPNEKTFMTWYSDFSDVITISDSALADLSLAGNIVYRPGSYWIKVQSDDKVYAVSTDGSIHWIESEEVAVDYAGSSWASRVQDVPDVFFTDYTVGSSLMTATVLDGMMYMSGGNYYVAMGGEARMVSSDGRDANGMQSVFFLTGSGIDASSLTAGADITSDASDLVDSAQTDASEETSLATSDETSDEASDEAVDETVAVTSSSAISAALSSSSPAAGTIAQTQALAELARFTFSGTGTVSSVTLMRSGLSNQNTLSNVYLFDGNTRLTDGYSFNSSSTLTINNLSIAVSGSKQISVKADVGNTDNAAIGATVAVSLTSMVLSGANDATAVSGATGSTMSVASGASLSSAWLSANTVAAASVNAGTSAHTIWSAPLQINTNSASLSAVNFRMSGSAPADALSDVKLYVNGVAQGSAATQSSISGSSYWTFDFASSPVTLATGSHTIDVRGAIGKGSSYDFIVSLHLAADMMLKDSQSGVNIAVLGASGVAFSANTAGRITISAGSITAVVDTSFTSTTTVSGGASNTTIAKIKLRAYGEDVKVNSLLILPVLAAGASSGSTTTATATVSVASPFATIAATITSGGLGYVAVPAVSVAVTGAVGSAVCATMPTATATIAAGLVTAISLTSGVCATAGELTLTVVSPVATTATIGSLQNVTLYFNGSQVGSQQAWSTGNLTFSPGSQMIVPAGVDSTLEVRADMRTSASVNYTVGTVTASVQIGSSNAEGQTSKSTSSFPSAAVSGGNSLTIQTGLLAVSQSASYASQSATPNTPAVKLGSYTLQNQSSSESVRVTSLLVAMSGTQAITNISGLYTSETSGSGASPIVPAASNTFSVDFTLAPGASKTLDIYAATSSETSRTSISTLTVTSIGLTSNVSTTSSAVMGQTISLSSGSIDAAPTLVTASSTQAQYIAASAGATDAVTATFNFASVGGAATISELKFTVSGSATNPVTSVRVGSSSAAPVSNVVYLTGLSLSVPNGGSGLTQNVYVSYANVGTSGVTPGQTAIITLTHIKYSSGTATTTLTPSTTPAVSVAAPTMTMVGSVPVVTLSSTQGTGLILNTTETKIADVTVSANAKGDIKVSNIVFTTGSSGFSTAPTGASAQRLADGTVTVVGSACSVTTAYTSGIVTTGLQTINVTSTTGMLVGRSFRIDGATAAIGTVASIASATEFDMTITTGGVTPAGNVTSAGMSTYCVFGTASDTDFDGYRVAAGTSKTFTLYGILVDGVNTSTGIPTLTTAVGTSTFIWDDASTAGGSGTALTGSLIYGFPTASYSIKQ